MKIHIAGAGTFPTVTDMIGVFSGLDLFSSFFDAKDRETFVTLRKHRPKSIVCDSGAHAYFSASGVKSASPVKLAARLLPPKEYVYGYAKFIGEVLPFVDRFVEFDTVEIHGAAFQKWQRACLLEAVGGDPSRLVAVYRASEPRAALRQIVDKFPCIGIEGYRNKNFTVREYLDICRFCYEAKVKLHAFASVDTNFLMQVPLYSSDSSSWSMIYRSGIYTRFNGRGLTTLHRSEIRKKFRNALGVAQPLSRMTTSRATAFRYRETIRRVLEQYEKLANYLTDVWRTRGIVWQ
jgi:hypothetical protein